MGPSSNNEPAERKDAGPAQERASSRSALPEGTAAAARPSSPVANGSERKRTPSSPPSASLPKAAPSESGRKKPVLASEVLKDDLAPVEPLARAVKYWGAVSGALFMGLGFSPATATGLVGSAAESGTAHWVLGALALAVCILPLRYRWRAAALLSVALACGVLGITGRGPAGAMADVTGEWGLLHLLATVALPAALLFRARYRAFPGARFILAAALVLTVPYTVFAVLRVVHGPLLVQVLSGVAIGTVLLSLLGFMGSETTGAGDFMAAGLIVAVTGQLGAEALVGTTALQQLAYALWSVASIASFAAAATIGAIGLFQLLAWRLGPEARAVDTRSRQPAERPRTHSITEWLTKR